MIIGMPFPLQPQIHRVELVAFRRIDDSGKRHGRLTPGKHGIAATVAVLVLANDRPSVHPLHRFEPHHAAIASLVLEVHEPIFAGCCPHPAALVGAVHRRVALLQHTPGLIGAIHVLAAGRHLPPHLHTSCGEHQIIISVSFIKLRAFSRVVHVIVPVIHYPRRTDNFRAFGIHLRHTNHGIDLRPAGRPGKGQVTTPVLVPQRARVNDALGWLDQYRLRPFSARVGCLDHIHAEIRIAPINVELSVVVTDTGRPHALAMPCHVVKLPGHHALQGIVHDFPVHQVRGMQDGQAGRTGKAGCCHVEVVPHRTNVRVGIIRMNHRILICAVTQIGRPYLRHIGLLLRFGTRHNAQSTAQQPKDTPANRKTHSLHKFSVAVCIL